MTDRHLHIISFDVPYPANYGGVIDVFYKQRWLTEKGVKVHLHCFQYGRDEADILNDCYEVKYYKRAMSVANALTRKPYIVASRRSEALVLDLLKDDYPILCEGIHTTAIMLDERLKGRKIFVRAHNVEHDYYRLLADSEKTFWKKAYYVQESRKLRRYETVLNKASGIFAVTAKDADYFAARYQNVTLVPLFTAFDKVCSKEGRGSYVLYHGNLSVAENENAAMWLIDKVFSQIDVPCIVAGMNPSEKLVAAVSRHANVSLMANPDDAAMMELIGNAQVNVLVTNQPTGMKLKLLNSLYNGRFCLVNPNMVMGTGLDALCIVKDDPDQMIGEIGRLMTTDFTQMDIINRDAALHEKYDNGANADKIIETIFG